MLYPIKHKTKKETYIQNHNERDEITCTRNEEKGLRNLICTGNMEGKSNRKRQRATCLKDLCKWLVEQMGGVGKIQTLHRIRCGESWSPTF